MERGTKGCVVVAVVALVGCGDGETDQDLPPTCESEKKLCPADADDPEGEQMCVDATSPAYGCANEDCKPCDLNGAVARCTSNGTCAISNCQDQNLDCNGQIADGCEVDTSTDPDNCGTCGRPCDGNCVSGRCE